MVLEKNYQFMNGKKQGRWVFDEQTKKKSVLRPSAIEVHYTQKGGVVCLTR